MGWVVLCSTSLGSTSDGEHSSEKAQHPARDKRRAILCKALRGEDDENSVDLSLLHQLQVYDDFAMGKGLHAKWYRNGLRLLYDYLFGIPDEEYFDEEYRHEKYSEEESSDEEDSQNEEHNGEHSNSLSPKEEESSEEEYWKWGEVFPIAKQLKERFTLEELLQMNIDLRRLFEIENLRRLPTSRPYTPEEESLLDKAIVALDRSGERR